MADNLTTEIYKTAATLSECTQLKFLPAQRQSAMIKLTQWMLKFATEKVSDDEAVAATTEFLQKTCGFSVPEDWMRSALEIWGPAEDRYKPQPAPGLYEVEYYEQELIEMYLKGGGRPD